MELLVIRLVHTVVWAVFAGSILMFPVAGILRSFDWALALTGVVFVEFAALAVNRGRCPLTDVAARYTDDHSDNFDIFLPAWIARQNKVIFGTLFVAGEAAVLWHWLG